ncbi:MAG: hypothetical protein RIS18_679 [Actinomycetota bacterium]
MSDKIVIRTCVGCNKKDEKTRLLRIIQLNGLLIIDQKKSLGSRGANLHKSIDCLNWAIKVKAFHKALKFSGTLDTSQVLKEFSSEVP